MLTQKLTAQEQKDIDHSYKPLTMKLSDDGSKYIRFLVWHQIWAETNNLSVGNAKTTITPSIRRSRFLMYSQVSPKFLILSHIGLNNFNPNNQTSLGNDGDSPQFFLHDAWVEFRVNSSLYMGGGLHYWRGLTRLASASTLNFMTLDQARPFAHWHSLGYTDQFVRHLGFYAKGDIGKLDYRVSINQPGANPIAGGRSFSNESTISYNGAYINNNQGDPTGRTILEGYFRYNFWDMESHKLPFEVGTHLGTKKVMGIGAGFFLHPNGAYDNAKNTHVSVNHFAVDAFLDMPTSDNRGAINAYVSYTNFNFGENYVGRWAGTGSNVYGHLGYYVKSAQLMPYVAVQIGDYKGHSDNENTPSNMSSINAGLNYYIQGHNAKLTLEWHQINNDLNTGADISQVRLQAHVFL
jgi:hypothetical protein